MIRRLNPERVNMITGMFVGTVTAILAILFTLWVVVSLLVGSFVIGRWLAT